MADKLDPARRSENMRRIKASGTAPEMAVARILRSLRLSYYGQARDLPGKPDFVLRKKRIAIFVHGCYWHRHPSKNCVDARLPKSNLDYWLPKLAGNVRRDRRNARKLRASGWRVINVWECKTARAERLAARLSKLIRRS